MERDVLEKILVQVLGVDASEIHGDTTFINDLGADSLDVFQIVSRLQEELDVELNPEDIQKIETVREAVALIKQTMAEK